MTGWEGSVTIALIGCSFLFAYLYVNTDNFNKFLKVLFLGASLLLGMGSLAIQDDILIENMVAQNATISNTLHSTYSMSIWVFRISMTLVMLWLIYAVLMLMLGKKKEELYGE